MHVSLAVKLSFVKHGGKKVEDREESDTKINMMTMIDVIKIFFLDKIKVTQEETIRDKKEVKLCYIIFFFQPM